MVNSGVNAIKDLQVGLLESRLYSGKIDGVWGKGSTDAANMLLDLAAKKRNKTVTGGLFATRTPDAIMKDIQGALNQIGIYDGKADGLYGDGTSLAFYTINKEYRQSKGLPEYDLCWSKRVPLDFIQDVKDWGDRVGLMWRGAHCCMGIMGFESAGTFDPAKQNMAGAKAFGLIQFMDGTAADLGTTTDKLRVMSQREQLQYVFKYFEMRMRAFGKFKRLDDFYLSVFYPKAIGMSPNEKIFVAGNKGYIQNNLLDLNKDGVITVGEISDKIYDSYFQGMELANRRTK